jgi:hypothetical protein
MTEITVYAVLGNYFYARQHSNFKLNKMKKTYFILMLAISIIAFTQQSVAQTDQLTSKTATKEKGYTVLNPSASIVIYQFKHWSHSPKEAEKYAPKYFFTSSSSDILQPLTKTNLKSAYPTNHAFHDALDENFREDKELILYDDFHKMYKIDHLLEMSTKK